MGHRAVRSREIPGWLRRLGVPAWVSGPDHRIVYLNGLAEKLLGIASREAEGLTCHQLIGARDEHGEPICRPDCTLSRQADAGAPLPPTRVIILGRRGEQHWLRLLPIGLTIDGREGTFVAHCGLDDDRAHRVESYLEHVVHRSRESSEQQEKLTPREWQILELLADDHSVKEIARGLGVSYSTVRNHVQHVLRKLSVHSIAEAVACHLLRRRPRA